MDNAATLFVDAPGEEGHGDRTALVTPAGSVSYAALQRLADRAAHALRVQGVEPEQRVALLMADGPGWAATFFGALKLGAVAVPLNTRLGPADLRAVLADCRPRVLVADRPLLEAAAIDPADAGGAGRRRRHGLLALHVGDHRFAEGGGALSPDAPRWPPLPRSHRRHRGRPGLRDVQALLRLRARQPAADPAPGPGDRVSPSRLAGPRRGGPGDAGVRPHALLLGAHGLRAPAAGGPACRHVPVRPTLHLGGRAAAGRRLRHLARALRGRDPGRHRGHRDRLHGALQPAGPEPGRVLRRAGARHRGPPPRRGGPAGGGRGGGCPLGPDAVAGRGVLSASRPLASDIRGRLVPDRRRLPSRAGRAPRSLWARG